MALALRDGTPLRFVAAGNARTSALAYERRIRECGEIATRERDHHDFCNALAWLMFPRTKAALNAIHVADAGRTGARSRRRDAATLIDEYGVIVLGAQPALVAMWRDHRWGALFGERVGEVEAGMQIAVLGHGLMAALERPFAALTAKALVICPAASQPAAADTIAGCDAEAQQRLAATATTFQPRALLPLPIAAWPGWDPLARGDERFADTRVFRPPPVRGIMHELTSDFASHCP
jgi:hypothetical protein